MSLYRLPAVIGPGTEGAPEHPASLVRQVLGGSGNGVHGGYDLQPRATSPASAQLEVTNGGATMQGRAAPNAGGYAIYNSGSDFVDWPANNTGATRYDMLVVRTEDPDFEGSRDRMLDDIDFFEVITGVSSTARTVADAGRPNYTAVPIALVARDGAGGAIQNTDITDLRELAKPRFDVIPAMWTTPDGGGESIVQADGIVAFPSYVNLSLRVPDWASTMDVVMQHFGLRMDGQVSAVAHDIFGAMYLETAGFRSASLYNRSWYGRFGDTSVGLVDSFDVLAAQGQSVTIRSLGEVRGGTDTTVQLEVVAANTLVQVTFREAIVPAGA